jgi:hypothetical protein
MIRGRIPSWGGSEIGYQLLPPKNEEGLTILKTASPSFRRNKKINKTKNMEAIPQARISFSIINSFNLRIDAQFTKKPKN